MLVAKAQHVGGGGGGGGKKKKTPPPPPKNQIIYDTSLGRFLLSGPSSNFMAQQGSVSSRRARGCWKQRV